MSDFNTEIGKYLSSGKNNYDKNEVMGAFDTIKSRLETTSDEDDSIFSLQQNEEVSYSDLVSRFYTNSKIKQNSLDSELAVLCEVADSNNDGKITQDELAQLFDLNDDKNITTFELTTNISLASSASTPAVLQTTPAFKVKVSDDLKYNGNFENKKVETKRAEEVNPDLFDGPVVTLSKYEQERILSSGFVDNFEGYSITKEGNCFWKLNDDGTKDYIRVVNDNGNYKLIHTTIGENSSNTEVFSFDRKDVANFTLSDCFSGTQKDKVKYDNLGNYHISAESGMSNLQEIIQRVYGVDVSSEKGQMIYEAIVNKNSLLSIKSPTTSIENASDVILVDDRELNAIENSKKTSNLFDSNVKITQNYVTDTPTMPYLLIGPENPDPNVEYPVIFYLHGMSSGMQNPNALRAVHSPGGFMTTDDWTLENFNGYVICPHLTGQYFNNGHWDNSVAEGYLRNLINEFSQTHNIDESRIAITGGSWGGKGTTYMASHMDDVFCAAATISGYPTSVDPSTINIPIRGYVGNADSTRAYMENTFANQIGRENYFLVSADHANAPKAAFSLDTEDNDNCSDLIQWLFKDSDNKTKAVSNDFKQSEPIYPQRQVANTTPYTPSGSIRNINWAELGYDAQTGQRFAYSAENVEQRLRAKGVSISGNCLGGVKDTFIEVTGSSPFGAPGQGITVASRCASVMENLEGYREIKNVSVAELQCLPAGAVVVWSSSNGEDAASKYGHISISLGDGRESSAAVNTQYRSVGVGGKPRVFIPVE
ncbi:MAG: hypothetical protein IJ877_07515 [Candidatus Gastranaerophilales bacterium]|nr:hypothetical protein [Candidatus Gastranaerophilales bacterium]